MTAMASGYNANMKRLLEPRPASRTSMNQMPLLSPTQESLFNNLRPHSAISYTYGRSHSPINLDGPTWLRNRPNSAIGIDGASVHRKSSAGYQRPYLTDASKIPPLQPRRPDEIRNSREIVALFDEIQTIEESADQESAKDEQSANGEVLNPLQKEVRIHALKRNC